MVWTLSGVSNEEGNCSLIFWMCGAAAERMRVEWMRVLWADFFGSRMLNWLRFSYAELTGSRMLNWPVLVCWIDFVSRWLRWLLWFSFAELLTSPFSSFWDDFLKFSFTELNSWILNCCAYFLSSHLLSCLLEFFLADLRCWVIPILCSDWINITHLLLRLCVKS